MSTESRGCVKVRSRLVSRICASVIADDDANYWLKTTPISYQVGHSIRLLLLLLLLIRLLCDKDAGDVENCRRQRQRQRSLSTVLTNSSRRRRRAGRHAGSRPVWSLRRDKVQLRVRAMQAETTVGTSALRPRCRRSPRRLLIVARRVIAPDDSACRGEAGGRGGWSGCGSGPAALVDEWRCSHLPRRLSVAAAAAAAAAAGQGAEDDLHRKNESTSRTN